MAGGGTPGRDGSVTGGGIADAINRRRGAGCGSRAVSCLTGGGVADAVNGACPGWFGRSGNRGFSLVELMLALALGLVVIGGMAQLFTGARQSHAALESAARSQESGRYAMAFVGHSARNAGFLGCNVRPERVVNMLNGDPGRLFLVKIAHAVEAFDNDGGGSAAAFAAAAGIDARRIVPGTDIVTFRRAEGPLFRVAEPVDPEGTLVIEERGSAGLKADDFLLVGDCERASLFRLTGTIRGAGRLRLLHNPGTGVYQNAPDRPLSPPGRVYGPAGAMGAATVRRVITETYFIGRGSGAGLHGEPPNSLWRRSGMAAAAEIVEGVNDLQIAFGRGFDDVPEGGVARALHVRIAAGDPSRPHAFAQTFSLRNAG